MWVVLASRSGFPVGGVGTITDVTLVGGVGTDPVIFFGCCGVNWVGLFGRLRVERVGLLSHLVFVDRVELFGLVVGLDPFGLVGGLEGRRVEVSVGFSGLGF